ncbi:nuclear transport factor 2 family protein [Pseudorhodoferax sp.]|uniref:nuclear transport factor 2 family protein n=1 Tax=Pseudorhodoferax sp. TaxID=1993553 RepID=UPI002DD62FE5|nr:nuclear transport factor 2 family protein [Pseudorhodoferax sp.]
MDLPRPVALFIDALVRRDAQALRAAFSRQALVIDQGRRHAGRAVVGAWVDRQLAGRPGFMAAPQAQRHGRAVLLALVPGVEWLLTAGHSRIDALVVCAAVPVGAQDVVAAFLQAVNVADLAALMACFACDAVVNDQLRAYAGHPAIGAWAVQEVLGAALSMQVTASVPHYDGAIVTVHLDGNFDKRGLPDPLSLVLYFSVAGGKIVRLVMLRTDP